MNKDNYYKKIEDISYQKITTIFSKEETKIILTIEAMLILSYIILILFNITNASSPDSDLSWSIRFLWGIIAIYSTFYTIDLDNDLKLKRKIMKIHFLASIHYVYMTFTLLIIAYNGIIIARSIGTEYFLQTVLLGLAMITYFSIIILYYILREQLIMIKIFQAILPLMNVLSAIFMSTSVWMGGAIVYLFVIMFSIELVFAGINTVETIATIFLVLITGLLPYYYIEYFYIWLISLILIVLSLSIYRLITTDITIYPLDFISVDKLGVFLVFGIKNWSILSVNVPVELYADNKKVSTFYINIKEGGVKKVTKFIPASGPLDKIKICIAGEKECNVMKNPYRIDLNELFNKIEVLDYPLSLGTEETGYANLKVSINENRYKWILDVLEVCLRNNVTKSDICLKNMSKDNEKIIEIPVKAGANEIELYVKYMNRMITIKEDIILIKKKESLILDNPTGEIVYPDGGVIRIPIKYRNKIVCSYLIPRLKSRIRGKAYFRKNSIEVVINKLSEPSKTIVLELEVECRGGSGTAHLFEYRFKAPIIPSKHIVSEYKSLINRYMQEIDGYLKNNLIYLALKAAEKALRECYKYKGLFDCSDIKKTHESISTEFNKKRREAEKHAALLEKLVNGKNILGISKVLDKFSNLKNLCKSVDYGRLCELVDRAKELFDTIQRQLNEGVFITHPRRIRSNQFYINIVIKNSSGDWLEDLTITIDPERHHVVTKYDIVIPPIAPGEEYRGRMKIFVKSSGKITIPYKVCLKDYCVYKSIEIMVGKAPARTGRVKISLSAISKPVAAFQRLGVRRIEYERIAPAINIKGYYCPGVIGYGGFAVTLYCVRGEDEYAVKVPPEVYRILKSMGHVREGITLTEDEKKAFYREISILSNLVHPNIIKLVDYGVTPFPFIVTEFCPYGGLDRVISTPVDPGTAVETLVQIAHALGTGHRMGKPIIHNDVKPSNILIDGNLKPKLSDFNISRIMTTVSRASGSKPGFTIGYAAPEQVLNDPDLPEISPATDVWAIGVILYEWLTGRKPFDILNYTYELRKLKEGKRPKPPHKINPKIPRKLSSLIVDEILAFYPEERIADGIELAGVLLETI